MLIFMQSNVLGSMKVLKMIKMLALAGIFFSFKNSSRERVKLARIR